MKPIKFNECNVVYGEGQADYLPLPAYKESNNTGQVVTCWELSDTDLDKIQKTKKIYVSQLTFHNPLQPIYISANKDEIFISPEED